MDIIWFLNMVGEKTIPPDSMFWVGRCFNYFSEAISLDKVEPGPFQSNFGHCGTLDFHFYAYCQS